MPDLRPVPNFALRRARNGIWEQAFDCLDDDAGAIVAREAWCVSCRSWQKVNLLNICQGCNYRDKIGSITINAEPWALKQVRKEHGHAGESNIWDQDRKKARDEAQAERVARMISVPEYQERVRREYGAELAEVGL